MNIVYNKTTEAPLKNGKPTESWMKEWSQEERIQKFFEFCTVFDQRKDQLLKEEYQIFSHRLHWHEHPYVDLANGIEDLEKLLHYTIVFSFTNEHWQTTKTLIDDDVPELRRYSRNNRMCRSDLFQVWYPKGTNVAEWLCTVPQQMAKDCAYLFKERKWTMMHFAYKLSEYLKEHHGFRNPLYPCKNIARYIAMSRPDLVDPNSILWGGTGHFDGLHQIFDGPHLMTGTYTISDDGDFIPKNKKAQLWLEQMHQLRDHESNPIHTHTMLNLEDKTCFFYKHISISHGAKKPTKRIPYNWIFSEDFEL